MQTLMRKSYLHQGVSSQGWMTNGKARCRVRHAINIDIVKKNSYNIIWALWYAVTVSPDN